ncbi:hypothetical protein BDB00DRAFT_849111, partial [Zychaea mexicana]|uniref:uncharacterized protein n=1 Tax=Zychaea mexicana TaxID=64656 RepID=UPI0022FE388B
MLSHTCSGGNHDNRGFTPFNPFPMLPFFPLLLLLRPSFSITPFRFHAVTPLDLFFLFYVCYVLPFSFTLVIFPPIPFSFTICHFPPFPFRFYVFLFVTMVPFSFPRSLFVHSCHFPTHSFSVTMFPFRHCGSLFVTLPK